MREGVSAVSAAMTGDASIPPFLTKTYDLVSSVKSNDIISWSQNGKSFVVHKPAEFARDLLPKSFKHSNFSSFVRQLNTYGFRKVDPDRWEFSNDNFRKDAKHLLKGIHRRKPAKAGVKAEEAHVSRGGTLVEVGQYGGSTTDEIAKLKRDKDVLYAEVVRLRQQVNYHESEIINSRRRQEEQAEKIREHDQQMGQIFSTIQQALSNPTLLHQFLSSGKTSNAFGVPYIESADAVGKRKKIKAKRPLVAEPMSSVEGFAFPTPGQDAGAANPASTSSYHSYLPEPTLPALPPSPMTSQMNAYFSGGLPQGTGGGPGLAERLDFKPGSAGHGVAEIPMDSLKLDKANSMGSLGEENGDGVEGIDSFLDFGDMPK